MFSKFFKKKGPESIEDRIRALGEFGIGLNPNRTVEQMLVSLEREEHARDPILLFVELGSEVEVGEHAGERFCDRLWHFDTECIEGHGDYRQIAERMAILAGGAMPIADITDHVDIEASTAWLRFTLDGKMHDWTAVVDDDWVDPTILGRFANLLAARKNGFRFSYLDLGGQDCVLGCLKATDLKRLRNVTGVNWQWLEASKIP